MTAHSVGRRRLHLKLIEELGATHAATLLEYLPPAPWDALERLGVPVTDLLASPKAA